VCKGHQALLGKRAPAGKCLVADDADRMQIVGHRRVPAARRSGLISAIAPMI
jgi:hypothetical protein